MTTKPIFLNKQLAQSTDESVTGTYVNLNGQTFFRIEQVDRIPPFFMSLVSPGDHWLFIGSNGGLSAGRKNEENALFPYYTDDKIIASAQETGSKSVLFIHQDGERVCWLPFSDSYRGVYSIRRNLYKNTWGNELLFEEVNLDLNLVFRYSWTFSETYGFVRKVFLKNTGSQTREIEILDGVQNILPPGISSQLQNQRSNLANAYKRNECESQTGLGIFSLSAQIVDRAEPSESLLANVAWCLGLQPQQILLSSRQLRGFEEGSAIHPEVDSKGEPGAYLIHATFSLDSGEEKDWVFCFEINQRQSQVRNLRAQLQGEASLLKAKVLEDVQHGTRKLRHLVAKADGLQLTGDRLSSGRHYSNVLFNAMRGGIFENHYVIDKKDLQAYMWECNQDVSRRNKVFLNQLPENLTLRDLEEILVGIEDADLKRICMEYLPLSFSRRHGDPSRPWNKFSIDLKHPDGTARKAYEGNWRDIFQNWEALALAFPCFAKGMIVKFLNASTLDGYNPYRISRAGVDWEVIEADDPWSYIGYWGDHQLVYLLKLLEIARSHRQFFLSEWANTPQFTFADVPYRIKEYSEIVKDPQNTISFDEKIHQRAITRSLGMGSDGKLIQSQSSELLKAGLMEKLLITYLSKVTNFIPDAGIWMNTQRPEWNDANNALVGNGASLVTLCYLVRFTEFVSDWIREEDLAKISLHSDVATLLERCQQLLEANQQTLQRGFDAVSRRKFADALGQAACDYRKKAYSGFDSSIQAVSVEGVLQFFETCKEFLLKSIQSNKRADGLYHSYNLVRFEENTLRTDHLYEMLEGQVAVLSSGVLSSKEALELLDAMKASALFRPDQYSYLLYPNRELPGFLQKNHIPVQRALENPLIQEMLRREDYRILEFDTEQSLNFQAHLNNSRTLSDQLSALRSAYPDFEEQYFEDMLSLYEEVFNHRAFTGRSGTFFAFEGLGSIYWHMVSKLLYAVQEFLSGDQGMEPSVRGKLIDHYYEIRAGIGINKTPDLYGAFPTDPYSHTPFHRGAQQPGMTGQVKEDIRSRWGEFGVQVKKGRISFEPSFLNPSEWLDSPARFNYFDLNGDEQVLALQAGQFAFTYCQIPVRYSKAGGPEIRVHFQENQMPLSCSFPVLPVSISQSIFLREGKVRLLEVFLGQD